MLLLMKGFKRGVAGGPIPVSGQLPIGFPLDPCTVSIAKVDRRGEGSFEREQNAHQKLGYIDLIYDTDRISPVEAGAQVVETDTFQRRG